MAAIFRRVNEALLIDGDRKRIIELARCASRPAETAARFSRCAVEALNAVVVHIGDEQIGFAPVCVARDGKSAGAAELAGLVAVRAPRRDEFSIARPFGNAVERAAVIRRVKKTIGVFAHARHQEKLAALCAIRTEAAQQFSIGIVNQDVRGVRVREREIAVAKHRQAFRAFQKPGRRARREPAAHKLSIRSPFLHAARIVGDENELSVAPNRDAARLQKLSVFAAFAAPDLRFRFGFGCFRRDGLRCFT